MKIHLLLTAVIFLPMTVSCQNASPTAGQIIDQIKNEVTCDWADETVDTIKGGSEEMKVTGIATTFLATLDVLKRANEKGLNMIITHEPTFYNHLDETERFEGDEVLAAKQQYIKDNNLIVWRFHDHLHRTEPDGIFTGTIDKLGWADYQSKEERRIFILPKTTLADLASYLKGVFKSETIRVVGNPDMELTNVVLVLGAPGSMAQIRQLQRDDVEVLIGGETHEWETVEYVRDAVSAGKKKALILLGHANSEESGMIYTANWLKTFIPDVPIEFVPAGDPFWAPK